MEKKQNLSNKEAKVSKKKATKKAKAVELDPAKFYSFESNGKHRLLPKGKVVSITGATARVFLKQGYGQIKS
tara:strand:+ start:2677 stop:2892 length:216 start_codon:yes stop_codon:yes gene_type:complete